MYLLAWFQGRAGSNREKDMGQEKNLASKERDVSGDNLPSLTSTLHIITGLTEQGCLTFPPDYQMRLF